MGIVKFMFPLLIVTMFSAACGNASTEASIGTKDSIDTRIPNTRVEVLDPEALAFMDTTARLEKLGEGYKWTEGPLYIADGDYLLFSDIPNNKVMKWKENQGVTVYLDSSGYSGPNVPEKEPGSNGLLLDKSGKLILCQHGARQIARMINPLNNPAPRFETIADQYQGKRFNSPNDAAFHPNGDLYITDPPYGLDKGNEDTAKQLDFHGVFRIKPDGKVDLVTKEFDYPNGIGVTPDGKFLIVAHSDSENPVWMKYELDENGLVKSKSVFYKISEEEKKLPGGPDGFKISKKGYVFASGPGGIWVFNPSGKPIARVYTGQATSNCALGREERSLFMTCDDFLYRVKLK